MSFRKLVDFKFTVLKIYIFLGISWVQKIDEKKQEVTEEDVEEGGYQELIEEEVMEGRAMWWFWRTLTTETSSMRIQENILEEEILGEEDG